MAYALYYQTCLDLGQGGQAEMLQEKCGALFGEAIFSHPLIDEFKKLELSEDGEDVLDGLDCVLYKVKKQKQRDQAVKVSRRRIVRLRRAIQALQSDQQKEEVTCFLKKIGQAFEMPVEKIFAKERLDDLVR